MKMRILTTLALVAVILAGSVQAASMSPIQARKELVSIGLKYDDGEELLKAIMKNDRAVVRLFIDAQGLDLNKSYNTPRGLNMPYAFQKVHELNITTPLFVAQVESQPETFEMLLKAGAKPVAGNITHALLKKDTTLLKKLFSAPGFRAEVIDHTHVYWAIACCVSGNDISVVQMVLSKAGDRAKVIVNQSMPGVVHPLPTRSLSLATHFHTKENGLLDLLVKNGAAINAVDPVVMRRRWQGADSPVADRLHPRTALMQAIERGNVAAVEHLLKTGADPNVVVVQENTAWIRLPPHYRRTALDFTDWLDKPRNPEALQQIKDMLKSAGAKTKDNLGTGGNQSRGNSNISSL